MVNTQHLIIDMFIEVEIIKNHTFNVKEDWIIENRFININNIEQVLEEDGKTYIILRNSNILTSNLDYKSLKEKINYIIKKTYN